MTTNTQIKSLWRQQGFSLPELLLVVAIFAIIGGASYPIVQNFNEASVYQEAMAKAEALTAAKILFYKSDPDAEEDWDDAKKDEEFFDLVKEYLYGGDSMEIADYTADPPYHQFDFGSDVRDKVKLIDPEDEDEDNS